MKVDAHLIVLVAFLATLAGYVVLAIGGFTGLGTLENVLLIEVGALAGITVPRPTAAP